ncbi:hypothetical protein V2J09_011345 [Rumex salicifolius]
MPIAGRPAKQSGGGGHGGEESESFSGNLWIGNLSPNVTESDLTEVLSKYGAIVDLTCYSSRNFAFVYYKDAESAKTAKDELQGCVIKGNPIKIEFAKPAKPSKHLWVGGISSSLTKEQLEEEFVRFGKIQDFKFLKDRNTALVEYVKLEDASAALKSLNGEQIGGENLRVDYLRSQPARREQFDFHDPRDIQFRRMGGLESSWTQNSVRFHPEAVYSGQKRHQPSQPFSGRKEGQPSRVLWVGYPPSVMIDEQMLHNAMILFGEIERIKCFPSRHYSFVEFRSIEEARNAKDNLQGKLFNDPRISIMFSNNDLAFKDFSDSYPGVQGQMPEMLIIDPGLDIIGHNNPLGPNNFLGGAPLGAVGPGGLRPFGPRGNFDGLLPTPEFNDPSMMHNPHEFGSPAGSNRRRMSSPAIGSLPPVGTRPLNKASGWDVLDANQIPRELKRARVDPGASFNGSPFNGTASQHEGAQLSKFHGGDRFSPADPAVLKGPHHMWRGVIAKGGSTVCHARCVPVGKGIDFHLPEVVDCSARTGLDMLAKHYAEAAGFDIVFFLPDSEEDFASYTEFLRYLASKSRAGVARFDDGTTMFLVPPSDFLTNVLNVVGPERLYGVVLKLARQASTDLPSEQQVNQSISSMHHMDQPPAPQPYDYNNAPSQQEPVLHMEHNNFGYNGSTSNTMTQMGPHDPTNSGSISASGTGVALTPELLATLTSLLPGNTQASVQSPQVPLSSSIAMASNPTPQPWDPQHQYAEQMGQSSLQFGNQMSSQAHYGSNFQTYPPFSHVPQALPANGQYQNPAYSYQYHPPQQSVVSSQPLNMIPDASHSHQYGASAQPGQPFQHDIQHSIQSGYGMGNGVASAASYSFQESQLPNNNPLNIPNQFQGLQHAENVVPGTSKLSSEPLKQTENNEPATDGEVDKNQRYQSTLQFAANLLLQIQQQQQAGQVYGRLVRVEQSVSGFEDVKITGLRAPALPQTNQPGAVRVHLLLHKLSLKKVACKWSRLFHYLRCKRNFT